MFIFPSLRNSFASPISICPDPSILGSSVLKSLHPSVSTLNTVEFGANHTGIVNSFVNPVVANSVSKFAVVVNSITMLIF